MRTNRKADRAKSVDCVNCGNPFLTRHSQGRYCSPACRRVAERASWRAYGARHADRRRRYHRQYYLENRDKLLAKTRAYQKSEAGKAAAKNNFENQQAKNPEKIFARHALRAAVLAGYIVPAACRCGSIKTQAHHTDYSEPFKVEWLCAPCHLEEHAAERAALVASMPRGKSGRFQKKPVGFLIEDGELARG